MSCIHDIRQLGLRCAARPLTLLAAEGAAFFALVLLLEWASADGDPWALLAQRASTLFWRLTG